MKRIFKLYLQEGEYKRLKEKAEALFPQGRGAIAQYIRKIANHPVAFLDDNVKAVTNLFDLKPKGDN